MALKDQVDLAADATFQARVLYAILNYVANTVLAETASEVQSLAITGGTPTSGNFFVTGGPLTQQINPQFNETAGALQARIKDVLSNGADVVCLGGPLPGTAISVTFTGSLKDSPQGLMAVGSSTLAPAGTAAVTRTTAGVGAMRHAERLSLASRVLAAPESYRGPFVQMVTTNAAVMTAAGSPAVQANVTDGQINTAVAAVFNAFLGA